MFSLDFDPPFLSNSDGLKGGVNEGTEDPAEPTNLFALTCVALVVVGFIAATDVVALLEEVTSGTFFNVDVVGIFVDVVVEPVFAVTGAPVFLAADVGTEESAEDDIFVVVPTIDLLAELTEGLFVATDVLVAAGFFTDTAESFLFVVGAEVSFGDLAADDMTLELAADVFDNVVTDSVLGIDVVDGFGVPNICDELLFGDLIPAETGALEFTADDFSDDTAEGILDATFMPTAVDACLFPLPCGEVIF